MEELKNRQPSILAEKPKSLNNDEANNPDGGHNNENDEVNNLAAPRRNGSFFI